MREKYILKISLYLFLFKRYHDRLKQKARSVLNLNVFDTKGKISSINELN